MKKYLILFLFFFQTVAHAQLTQLLHMYESESGFCSCIERDNNGFIYTAGRIGKNAIAASGDTIRNKGMFLTKMNSSGIEIWRMNNIKGEEITPRSILIDDASNIYVVGNFYDTMKVGAQMFTTVISHARKFFIAKYNSNGNFKWIKVSSSDESFIYSADIRNNSLFLAGGFSNTFNYYGNNLTSAGATDICILKLDTAGIWVSGSRYGGIGLDNASKIKTDNNGNIFVCGEYSASFLISTFSLIAHGYQDCFLMKLNASMNVSWVKTAGSTAYDEMRSLAIDSSGNIFVVGRSGNYTFFIDPNVSTLNFNNYRSGFIAEFDSNGVYLKLATTINSGNTIDIDLINNNPVVCGRARPGAQIPLDSSIPFSLSNIQCNGYFILLDQNLNALSIGKYSAALASNTERCFRVLNNGNNSFLIGGFCGSDVKMPDSTYFHSSTIYSNGLNGGSVFLQKINVPHLTVTPSDTLILPTIYSTYHPLNLILNFSGQGLSPSASEVKLGYPKTVNANYYFEGYGNLNLNTVTVTSSLNNPTSGSGSYFLNLNFSDKNIMIRSENQLNYCSSFSGSIAGPSVICAGDTITVTAYQFYQNYIWYPEASVITQNQNVITSVPSSNATYIYTAHSGSNCAFGTKAVNVNNQSLAHISLFNTSTSGCNPIHFSYEVFNCVSLSGGVFVYFYKNGILTSSSTSASGVFTATTVGDYYVRAVSGCGWDVYSDTIHITSIIPTITSAGTLVSSLTYMCNGSSAHLALTNHPVNIYYEWYYNNYIIPNANQDTLNVNQTGTYYVRVYNQCGNYVTSNYAYLNPLGVPSVYISTSSMIQGCSGSNVIFNSSYVNYGNGTLIFQWYRDGVTISGATLNNYTTNQSGNYTLRINHACGSTYSNIISVHLNNPVVASIGTTGLTSLCSGQSALLTASPGIDYQYQWRFNGIDVLDSTGLSFIATQQGSYTCLVSNFCNSNLSNALNISVAPSLPDSIETNDSLNICPGQTVTFNALFISGINYLWYRNGNPVNGATGNTYQTSISGVYSCRFSNQCGTIFSNNLILSSFNLTNIIYAPNGSNLCPGDSVYLFATANNQLSYQWKLNGSNISGGTHNFYYATTTGVYSCEFSSISCGTFNSTVISVNVFQLSSLVITSSQGNVLCPGVTVDLIAPSGSGFLFQWLSGNVVISGATNSVYSTQQQGTYSCIIQSNCLSDTTNALVLSAGSAQPSISISFSGNDTICSNTSSLLISNGINVTSYQWMFNGINISGATNSTYSAQVQGVYQCQAQNYCGSLTSNGLQLHVISVPVSTVTLSGDSIFCEGESTVLSVAGNPAFNYQWYHDGIQISGATNNQDVVSGGGSYFCYTQSPCGNYFSQTINITVNATPPIPSFSISGNLLSCLSSAVSYQWYFNGVAIFGAINQNYQATQAGFYTVEVFNNSGCSSIAIPLYYSSQSFIPVTSFSYSATQICVGECITFSDNSSNQPNYWNWSFQGGSPAISIQANPTVCFNQSGLYNVQLITGNFYGYDTLMLMQLVNTSSIPTAIITQHDDTLFTTSGLLQYQWLLNGSAISGATNYFYIANTSGNYKVFVESGGGCSNTTPFNYSFTAKPFAALNLSDNNICEGDCISLTDISTNQPTSWHWILPGTSIGNTNSQNPNVCYNQAGAFDVTLISSNATGSDTLVMNNLVTVNALPVTPAISLSGNILSTTLYSSYQWYLNGNIINGAIYQQIIILNYGNYSVAVTDSFGCSSQSIEFNFTGAEDLTANEFRIVIAPNPADDLINVSFSNYSISSNVRLVLLNELGQVMQSKIILLKTGTTNEIINSANLASGCYILEIKGENNTYTKKIVVAH